MLQPGPFYVQLVKSKVWRIFFLHSLLFSLHPQLVLAIEIGDPATDVLIKLSDPAKRPTYAALVELSKIPISTIWDRAPGRQS
jgi:hypothetical protein